jgi:hypothetical protein
LLVNFNIVNFNNVKINKIFSIFGYAPSVLGILEIDTLIC